MRGLLLIVLLCLLAACGAPSAAPTTTPAPIVTEAADVVIAPTSIPTGAPAVSDRFSTLPQTIDAGGFPRLGYPSATVPIVIFAAFDDPASAGFYTTGFEALLERARTGEAALTFVPMAGRTSVVGGRGAVRAALCAGEQGAFWRYADVLFAAIAAGGDSSQAIAAPTLLAIVDTLGIDRAAWDACMLTDRGDSALAAGEIAASNTIGFTSAPFVTINGSPSLTDPESLRAILAMEIDRVDTLIDTAIAATPDAESTAETTETPEPLTGDRITPPFSLALPAGWLAGYDVISLQDLDATRPVPVAVYSGAVAGGTGTIVLLWGFPNLVNGNPFLAQTVEPNLFSDGLRLLRLAVVEQGCNIGTDLRREYAIGGLTAIGTQFAAVDCPELPDTRGWFAGLQQENVNYVFYMYTDPIEAMDAADEELQRVLDTIRFRPIASITIATAAP